MSNNKKHISNAAIAKIVTDKIGDMVSITFAKGVNTICMGAVKMGDEGSEVEVGYALAVGARERELLAEAIDRMAKEQGIKGESIPTGPRSEYTPDGERIADDEVKKKK